LQDKFIKAQGEAEDVGTAPENQDYSDAAGLAIKRNEIAKEEPTDEDDEAADIGELSDADDDDEDSEMDEVDA
jgi:hypothetical protein